MVLIARSAYYTEIENAVGSANALEGNPRWRKAAFWTCRHLSNGVRRGDDVRLFENLRNQSVFRNAMSARRSAPDRLRPKVWPLTANVGRS